MQFSADNIIRVAEFRLITKSAEDYASINSKYISTTERLDLDYERFFRFLLLCLKSNFHKTQFDIYFNDRWYYDCKIGDVVAKIDITDAYFQPFNSVNTVKINSMQIKEIIFIESGKLKIIAHENYYYKSPGPIRTTRASFGL